MAKSKIKFAKKSVLDPDEFDLKQTKVLISLRLDGDVLASVKSAAKAQRLPYGKMINELLRTTFVSNSRPSLDFGQPLLQAREGEASDATMIADLLRDLAARLGETEARLAKIEMKKRT